MILVKIVNNKEEQWRWLVRKSLAASVYTNSE